MIYKVVDFEGKPLDARYEIDGDSIVFHSRAESSTPGAQHAHYGPALRVLLQRLSKAGLRISGAWVDSLAASRLSEEERRGLGTLRTCEECLSRESTQSRPMLIDGPLIWNPLCFR